MKPSTGTNKPIVLPAVLDLAAADGFLELMCKEAEPDRSPCLDASGVETITLPCIQVILAAIKSHGRIAISNPSAEFVAAFNDLGLDWKRSGEEIPEELQNIPFESTLSSESDPPSDAASSLDSGPPPESAPLAEPGSTQMQQPAESPDRLQERMEDDAMKKRILTIDDSRTMREMLMVTLDEAGFDVIQGVDGQDGLKTLGDDRVDVVITDINMPKMDGYEVIRQLRRNPVHKTTPVLVLTTESDTEKRNLARQAGATGWMVKPFDPAQLVATIRKVCP